MKKDKEVPEAVIHTQKNSSSTINLSSTLNSEEGQEVTLTHLYKTLVNLTKVLETLVGCVNAPARIRNFTLPYKTTVVL